MGHLFLGVSYIISGIPFINILGLLLIPIGWFILGKKYARGLWMITGVVGIVSVIISFAIVLYFLTFIKTRFISYEKFLQVNMYIRYEFFDFIKFSKELLLIVSLWLLIVIIYGALQLISLWTAGTYFKQVLLKVSVAMYLISIMISPFFIILPITMLITIILVYVSNIIAGVGFLLIKYESSGY